MNARPYLRTSRALLTVPVLVAAVVVAALGLLTLRTAQASPAGQAFPTSCAGTYLIQEGSGTRSLWTLEKDGTFVGTSSAQRAFNFSDQQGSWERDGANGVKAVLLDFSFDAGGAAINVGRIDISLNTAGNGCDNVAGSFTLRFFEAGEDPLDPASDTGAPISDTFTGRRVSVGR